MAKANTLPSSIAPMNANLPAHLQSAAPMGNENVSSSDVQIPRIKILHTLSPEVDEDSPKYVDGAKAGQYINTVSLECFDELYVVNLYFETKFVVFKKRTEGGGYFGAYPSEQAALDALDKEGEDVNKYDVTETAEHALLLLDKDGNVSMPAIYDMSGSRLSVSRNWNSKITNLGNVDRFGTVWKLTTKRQKNAKGSWHNPEFDAVGYASQEIWTKAKEMYQNFKGLN